MMTIKNYLEPHRLLVAWQLPHGSGEGHTRTRHIIGEITKPNDIPTFRYLTDTDDFHQAKSIGFNGLQAFKISTESYTNNVMEVFIRRLPPRKREDFKAYLSNFGLPDDFTGSDFALLAHTGAKLPSDGFEIFPDLSAQAIPFDFVMEVAGTRYVNPQLEKLSLGQEITFELDPSNQYDCNAVNVLSDGNHIGFVPKPYNKEFCNYLKKNNVTASIQKLNGKPNRPVIYLYVSIK